jgi:hypothetical protein
MEAVRLHPANQLQLYLSHTVQLQSIVRDFSDFLAGEEHMKDPLRDSCTEVHYTCNGLLVHLKAAKIVNKEFRMMHTQTARMETWP